MGSDRPFARDDDRVTVVTIISVGIDLVINASLLLGTISASIVRQIRQRTNDGYDFHL